MSAVRKRGLAAHAMSSARGENELSVSPPPDVKRGVSGEGPVCTRGLLHLGCYLPSGTMFTESMPSICTPSRVSPVRVALVLSSVRFSSCVLK